MTTPPGTNDGLRDQYFEDKKIAFDLACSEGNSNGCFSLGEWYQMVRKDFKKAAALYDENCHKRQHGNSCFNLSMLYLNGALKKDAEGNLQDDAPLPETMDADLAKVDDFQRRAIVLQKRACELGNGQACTSAAQFMVAGKACEKDIQGGMTNYKIGCERDDPIACFKLGAMYLKAEKYAMDRDAAAAFKLMKKGCELGHPNACQVLAVMYKKGDGVEQNEKLFEKYRDLTKEIVKQTGERMGATVL